VNLPTPGRIYVGQLSESALFLLFALRGQNITLKLNAIVFTYVESRTNGTYIQATLTFVMTRTDFEQPLSQEPRREVWTGSIPILSDIILRSSLTKASQKFHRVLNSQSHRVIDFVEQWNFSS
jgi:hypothetical protein